MQNLLFLVKAGLIQDPEGKIAALASNPKTAPVLPARPDTTELGTKVDKVDYEISDDPVTLKMSAGYALFAHFRADLFGDDGKLIRPVYKGTNTDNIPDSVVLGQGPELIGKILVIQAIISNPSPATVPGNVIYELSGGKQPRIFTRSTQVVHGVASPLPTVISFVKGSDQ